MSHTKPLLDPEMKCSYLNPPCFRPGCNSVNWSSQKNYLPPLPFYSVFQLRGQTPPHVYYPQIEMPLNALPEFATIRGKFS